MSVDIEKLVRNAVIQAVNDRCEPKNENQKRKIDFISLSDAKFIAEKVEERACELGVRAVVAISDDGGNLKLCECMDGSYLASRDIAVNKSYTAVALKMSTAKLATLAAPNGPLYGIQNTNGGRIVIFGGGDTLELRGVIFGGIGVSGGSAEQDTELSEYGKRVFEEYFS